MCWKIRLRFRLARAVSSTWNVIFGAYLVEHLARWPGPVTYNVVKTLPDALGRTGLGRQIEQLLIGFRVLHHGGGFFIHGQSNILILLVEPIGIEPTTS